MGQGIGELNVGVTARTQKARKNVNGFRKDLGKIGPEAAKTGRGMATLSKGFNAFGNQLLGIASLALVTRSITQSFQAIDKLAKTSEKLGIPTERLAGLRFAAEQTGVEINTLDTGLQRMVRRIADAAAGTGEAAGALRELGLDAKSLNQLSPDQQFRSIADSMGKVNNQADKVRLTFKLFDSEGVSLINTLKLGTSGLNAFQKQAEALGIAITRLEAKQIEKANDATGRMKKAWDGLANTAAIALAPAIETVAGAWTNNFAALSGGLDAVETINKTTDATEKLAEATEREAQAIKKQQDAIRKREQERKSGLDNFQKQIEALDKRIQLADFGKVGKAALDLNALNKLGVDERGKNLFSDKTRQAEQAELRAQQRDKLQGLETRLRNTGKSSLEADRDNFLGSAATDQLGKRGEALFGKLIEAEKAAEDRLKLERDTTRLRRQQERERQQAAKEDAKKFRRSVEQRAEIAGRGNPGAVDARSAEGFAALRSSIRQDAQQKILDVNRQQLKHLEKIADKKPVELQTYSMN